MTCTEAIREGFRIVHGNWQLIVVQLVMAIAGGIGFVVIVGIPLAVVVLMLGLDIAELGNPGELLGMLSEPAEIISRYAGVILIAALSVLFYLTFMFSLWTYVLGGSAGVIRDAVIKGPVIKGPHVRFRLGVFLSEGRKLFFPLTGYLTVVGLIFTGIFLVLGAMGGAMAVLVSGMFFLKIFFMLSFVLLGIVAAVGLLIITVQGMVALVFEGTGVFRSLKETLAYLEKTPGVLGLYGIAITGYILMYFMLMLLGYPFKLVPVVGAFLSLPYHFVSYVVRGYFCLVALASVSAYYFSTTASGAPGASGASGASGSTAASGISGQGVQVQGPPPLPLDKPPSG